MKKLISLLLALSFVCALIPMAVSATSDESGTPNSIQQETRKKDDKKDKNDKKDKTDKNKHDKHDKHKKRPPVLVHAPNQHSYNGYGFDTKYHWLECACGCKITMEPHVNPLDTDDNYCVCGYHFSDNADLVTLWVKDCPVIKNFNKNKTEYKLDAYTYKDVKEIAISTRTFDSQATVELPEDLTLKEGENKFEIKVTSESQKVTKVYTVIVTKESKK